LLVAFDFTRAADLLRLPEGARWDVQLKNKISLAGHFGQINCFFNRASVWIDPGLTSDKDWVL